MNKYGSVIWKCSKCGKDIERRKGYYIQIINRESRDKGETGFICCKCEKRLTRWFNRK